MKTPEEYREEMMRMYRLARPQQSAPMPDPEPMPSMQPQPVPRPEPMPSMQPQPVPRPEPMPSMQPQPAPRPEPMPPMQPQPAPRPEPILPPEEEPSGPVPLPTPQEPPLPEDGILPLPPVLPDVDDEEDTDEIPPIPIPEESAFGWLKVTTRTADSAYPVEGVSVLILRQNGTETRLLYSLLTDQSGETPRVQLPAPPLSGEQNQAYSTYQVQVFSPGYMRMESDNVPVFSGITSLQPFSMIPLPADEEDNGNTVIYQNTEPIF